MRNWEQNEIESEICKPESKIAAAIKSATGLGCYADVRTNTLIKMFSDNWLNIYIFEKLKSNAQMLVDYSNIHVDYILKF